jgi:hypothetical protein
MEWRKKLALSFVPLICAMYFLMSKEKEISIVEPGRKLASMPKPHRDHYTKKIVHHRTIAAFKSKIVTHQIYKNRIPQSVESSLQKDKEIRVTRGFDFLKDVGAIPKDEYKASMGEIIQQNENFVFFKAGENHHYIPVAMTKSTRLIYPISSILHIKGATAAVRQEVLNAGFNQYYYHAPLKFLSVESKSGGVLETYKDLQGRGLKVELEVLRPGHQSH